MFFRRTSREVADSLIDKVIFKSLQKKRAYRDSSSPPVASRTRFEMGHSKGTEYMMMWYNTLDNIYTLLLVATVD